MKKVTVGNVIEFIEEIRKITMDEKTAVVQREEQLAYKKDLQLQIEEIKKRMHYEYKAANEKSNKNNRMSASVEIGRLAIELQMLLDMQERLKEDIVYRYVDKERRVFFYRGHYDAVQYKLIPSIMRTNKSGMSELHKEDYYYHQIKVQCPEAFINNNHMDQLVKMQHYNCPTRLLDVTGNPLVALYFACKNYGCKDCTLKNLGAVYVFNVPEKNVLYYDSDKVRMLASLPPLTYNEKADLWRECIKKTIEGKRFNNSNNTRVVEKLYHEIRTETPSFEKNIDPLDLISSYFVLPLKTNSRILKQNGAFIINGLCMDSFDIEDRLKNMCCYKIEITNKDRILEELDMLGINEATLFPEMDKVADYLKQR